MNIFMNNMEIEMEDAYLLWMENYQSIPYDLSPRYHKAISFSGFCDYMIDRFHWRIK